jgi:curved DNA-binding protein CbpA
MSNEFDPKKIIDFEKDYYNLLDLDKDSFPPNKTRDDKVKVSKLLESSFRKKARTCHPDFGGSIEDFLDIVRARRILEDPILKKIYDQGFFEEFNLENVNSGFEVDWTKIGNYRKGTPEDTIGFSIYLKICDKAKQLNIVPAFYPSSNEHNYEWDFVILDSDKKKLVISIVNDENEVLRLTNSSNIEENLPFKIFICIPKTGLSFQRQDNMIFNENGKIMANGQIMGVSYNDQNLLESTSLDVTHKYIEESLEEDLLLFKDGKLNKLSSNNEKTKWLDSEQIKRIDKEKISEILNLRSFVFQNNENAADFLDNITNKNTIKRKNDKPQLPI